MGDGANSLFKVFGWMRVLIVTTYRYRCIYIYSMLMYVGSTSVCRKLQSFTSLNCEVPLFCLWQHKYTCVHVHVYDR